MPKTAVEDMVKAIAKRAPAAITMTNRIEGRPRTRDFNRSLQAEVRDALWMLTRQWQTGEFDGDDAGSPFYSKLCVETAKLTKYQARDNSPMEFPIENPLESIVERMPLVLEQAGHLMSLDIRLLMGRYWLKLLRAVPGYDATFRKKYPIRRVVDEPDIQPHPEIVQAIDSFEGRSMDGGSLYLYLKADVAHRPYDHLEVSEIDKPAIDVLAKKFLRWIERLLLQPLSNSESAWDQSRLEYRFRCAHPTRTGERVLKIGEYSQGHLDWYNFNIDDEQDRLDVDVNVADAFTRKTTTVIAGPAQFAGMPKTRWWEFEDGQTNFGDISASTTDLAKLLFIEFGLLYANDWFVVPVTLPCGSVTNVRGLVVTNVFGERFWIGAAGRGKDDDWNRWSMFTVAHDKPRDRHDVPRPADIGLLLPPVLPQSQESAPIEEVLMFRDETANMAWAIEKIVPMVDGVSKSGSEAAAEFQDWKAHQANTDSASPVPKGVFTKFQLMSSVPDNWHPFIPVRISDDNREIQLQRGKLTANAELRHHPRTSLLREGLETNQPFFLHEEEISRAGVRLTKTYQRARWENGRVVMWIGIRKHVGRGEGSSGLMFDQIENVRQSE